MRTSRSPRCFRRFYKGGSSSGAGAGAGAGSSGGAASQSRLPEGVQISEDSIAREYSFELEGNTVILSINKLTSPGEVNFSVNGSLDIEGNLSTRASRRASLNLFRIIEADARTREDGFLYKASAWTFDGSGAKRAAAYERAGFSRPVNGEPGREQYAVVRRGRMEPANDVVLRMERTLGITQESVNRNIAAAQRERRLERIRRMQDRRED